MYIIEGNVGVGKSTFLRLLAAQLPEVQALFEPVNAWSGSASTQSLLNNFYTDTPRWSYTMETFTLFTRIRDYHKDASAYEQKTIAERSIYSGYYCFAKNGYQQGHMQPIEWLMYTQWFEFLVPRITPPRGFIYLKSDPTICHARTHKRNRSGEETIPLSYLQEIHEQHESFLIRKEQVASSLEDVPVLVLDVSEEFEHKPELMTQYAQKVKQFIELTVAKSL